jgi:hypothetical protein
MLRPRLPEPMAKHTGQRLILLMGMPRSGTTWLGKIFDSHADTLYRHEPDSVQAIRGVPPIADVASAEQYRRAIIEFVDALPGIRFTKVTTTLPVFRKSYDSRIQFLARRVNVFASKLAGRVLGELPVAERTDYRRIVDLPVVWKSIESTGRLGVLCRAIERCRAVLILRHPCGYIASVFRGEAQRKFNDPGTLAHENYGMFEKLLATPQARSHGLSLDAIKCMHPVERLAWRWVIYNEKAMDDIAGLSNCSHIRYEDLCRDPLAQARRLFDFAGLSWNAQTEAFIGRSTASEHDSYYSIFKNPLKSAYKWRSQLAAEDIARVLAVVTPTKPGRLYAGIE